MSWIEILVILIALVIQIAVIYFIILNAVSRSIKESEIKESIKSVHEALRLNNRLLIQDLLNKGVDYKRIQQLEDLSKPAFENYRLTIGF